jgi:hypothetical protein
LVVAGRWFAKEMVMRKLLLGVVALGIAVAGDLRPSEARPLRPWCAVYATNSIGEECLFDTYAQCMATVRGIGGFCRQTVYPPPGPRRRGHNTWWPFYPD